MRTLEMSIETEHAIRLSLRKSMADARAEREDAERLNNDTLAKFWDERYRQYSRTYQKVCDL